MNRSLIIRATAFGILSLMGSSAAASSAVITKCGGSEGYSYFMESALVAKKDVGWTKDQTSNGSYLLLKEGDRFDIVFSDATGRTISSAEDGAQIVPISANDGTQILIVNYPGVTIEMWTFHVDGQGRGEVFVHQARYGAVPIRKQGVYHAVCAK